MAVLLLNVLCCLLAIEQSQTSTLIDVTGTPVPSRNITLGFLLAKPHLSGPMNVNGLLVAGAMPLALRYLNSNSSLLPPGFQLDFMCHDTGADTLRGTNALTQQWRDGAVAFFGPEMTCDVEARVAAAWNLPMISYNCADNQVSDKSLYPTFARTSPPAAQLTKSLISLLRHFRWHKFSIVVDQRDSWLSIAVKVSDIARDHNMTVNGRYEYDNDMVTTDHPFPKLVESSYITTRVYLFLGEMNSMLYFMWALSERGLLEDGRYIVIHVDLQAYETDPGKDKRTKYLRFSGSIYLEQSQFEKEAQSLLVVVASPPSNPDYAKFKDDVNENRMYFGGQFAMWQKTKIPVYAAYLYDSVLLYAAALREVVLEGGSPDNGTAIINKIRGRSYTSIQGFTTRIDENGDAEGNFTLLSRQPYPSTNYSFLPVGTFEMDTEVDNGALPLLHIDERISIDWVGGVPPVDEPECGYHGEYCIEPQNYAVEIAAGVIGSGFLIALIVVITLYRNWRYEQEIAGLLWRINILELQSLNTPQNTQSRRMSGQLSLESQSLCTSVTSAMSLGQVFTSMASYKGQLVALKTLVKAGSDISRSAKKEMKFMKDLRHDNVNAFVGACVHGDNLILVTEYCKKGSLQDILENEDVLLDWMFIASLVFDLIKGMIFLHDSEIRVHGNLCSSNCVVTSRWSLQVTDFGLLEMRRRCHERDESNIVATRQQWLAPEVLRDPSGMKITQKADVYSFGIILFEILGRRGPYGDLGMTTEEIIQRLRQPSPSDPLLRPNVESLETADYMKACMADCWEELPEARPDFKQVRARLKDLRHGMKANIFDNMVSMMERYQSNLEELVADRTDQLMEEKRRTEALLHRMLPKSVADQLKSGQAVVPETYECVTIYFSDICGFTSLSADSTPMQVVNLLNDLYTTFDSIIRGYDVYKVETIGDAYMVVSGLPIRNGDRHAGEVASLSLHLLSAIKTFKIRHKPDETLKLRVGIHSGAVVTGVVGMTMPRYCLFGDTVNTASRMESNGEPLKIHISSSCKYLLDKLGGYVIESRGIIPLKGKGDMLTFWLLAEDKSVRMQRTACSAYSDGLRDEYRPNLCNLTNHRYSFRNPYNSPARRTSGAGIVSSFGNTNRRTSLLENIHSSYDFEDNCDVTDILFHNRKVERTVSFREGSTSEQAHLMKDREGLSGHISHNYAKLPSIVVDRVSSKDSDMNCNSSTPKSIASKKRRMKRSGAKSFEETSMIVM